MKSIGVSRKIDDLGRVVIPKEIREIMNYEDKQELNFFVEGNRVILIKNNHECSFCKGTDELLEFKETCLCKNCAKNIGDLKK